MGLVVHRIVLGKQTDIPQVVGYIIYKKLGKIVNKLQLTSLGNMCVFS